MSESAQRRIKWDVDARLVEPFTLLTAPLIWTLSMPMVIENRALVRSEIALETEFEFDKSETKILLIKRRDWNERRMPSVAGEGATNTR